MSVYYVSPYGSDKASGSEDTPFQTISKAAKIAQRGDKVIVREGVYREWVKPEHSGYSHTERITYEAAEGEKVVIKGSERISNWENTEGTVWKVSLPNAFFGDYNPYLEVLGGDWFVYPLEWNLHPGDVYLDGKSFYEAKTLEEVKHPERREYGFVPPWSKFKEKILEPERTVYTWRAEVDDEFTTIYANFQGENPNEHLTEINVRKCCFYPDKTNLNYITVRGFEMCHAATPWTPPTADQPGLLGTHWSKGWVIENNIIHDSKCSAISIGKEASTGHNLCTRRHRKPGYQYQMEAVFQAYKIGWSKEKTGSHLIRNNTIYDCGQNGIVGHLGCVFSQIYNNHIYNIAVKHEYFGYEIAGIKLHAAIDVRIMGNNIHHCTLGTWLDWQAQGTRVSRNLYYKNDRDLMIEVTHGPHIVDNNIFGSQYNFDNAAEGGAYLHNLFAGVTRRINILDRSTPYHFPHSTDPAGSTVVYGGDDRFYQNLFLFRKEWEADEKEAEKISGFTREQTFYSATESYNGSPGSLEEYIEQVYAVGNGDLEVFQQVLQPVYINTNAYLNGAAAYNGEESNFKTESDPEYQIVEEADGTYLQINILPGVFDLDTCVLDTNCLGSPRIVDQGYENPDGTAIQFDTDYTGSKRGNKPAVGPFEALKAGLNKIKVWQGGLL
ncbi:right-handed parallel beta-helix repeat-containing protein [Lachnospiraceae bacterium 54-53]